MAETNPLEYAIQLEQDGLAFYTKAAAETANPLGKKMFESLAADEKRHEAILRRVAQEMDARLPDDLPTQRLVTLFATLGEAMKRELGGAADDTKVIEKALEMEKASYVHYSQQAKKAAVAAHRSLYARLAQEEDQHTDILMNTLAYLNRTGQWFLWDEKALLD